LNKVLLKLEKEAIEPAQRKALFTNACKAKEKCCKVVIDNISINNLVSTKVVEKLNLKKTKHPTPYKVSRLQKVHQLLVNEHCEVGLQIGNYMEKIPCDVMPTDVCHILLGKP